MSGNWTVEQIRATYRDRPLRIRVPKIVAYLTARLGLVAEDRTWSPEKGLVIQRGRSNKNVESFSVQQLAEAHHPDINYISVVDAVRQLQLWYNFLARPLNEWLGLPVPVLTPLDLYGHIRWHAVTGQETIHLELVEHPAALAHLLESLSKTVWEDQKLDIEANEVIGRNRRIREIWRRQQQREGPENH